MPRGLESGLRAGGNHNLGEEFVKKIPKLLEDPIAIIESNRNDKKDKGVVAIIGERNPKTNHQIIAAVEIGAELQLSGEPYDGYAVTTVHGRENAFNLLKRALQNEIDHGHGVFYIQEEKANAAYEDFLKTKNTTQTEQNKINGPKGRGLASLGRNGVIHNINDPGSVVKVYPKKQTETKFRFVQKNPALSDRYLRRLKKGSNLQPLG